MSAVGVSESVVRPILAEAVDLARRALVELEPFGVGVHVGVTAEGDSAATHYFEATLAGYRGWQWAVVVAAPPEAGHVTVSESALLPGPEALVAPDFLPWDQRIRPGDLAPGDLLAPPLDDPRLVPGYLATGDPEIDDVVLELGFGRTQVLSRVGREDAADRWFSEFGPETDMARAAPSTCGRCGFFVPLAGALHAAFGVCANAMGADGRVVHTAYGCGAHSDTELPTGAGSPAYEAYDDAAVDLIPNSELRPAAADAAAAGETAVEGATDPAATAAEIASPAENAAPSTEPAGDAATPPAATAVSASSVETAQAAGTAECTPITADAPESATAVAAEADSASPEPTAPLESAPESPAVSEAVAPVSVPAHEVPASASPDATPALFGIDPDSRYDDAWAVTEVKVDADPTAPESDPFAE